MRISVDQEVNDLTSDHTLTARVSRVRSILLFGDLVEKGVSPTIIRAKKNGTLPGDLTNEPSNVHEHAVGSKAFLSAGSALR